MQQFVLLKLNYTEGILNGRYQTILVRVPEILQNIYTYCNLFTFKNGDFCLCGDNFGRFGQLDAVCSIQCRGLSPRDRTTCGGPSSNDIFAVHGEFKLLKTKNSMHMLN